MSKIEVNAIEPQCGTTLTIGASNTSIAGIGTVNWDTTAKTAAFTAVSGRGYFVNTTSGAITVTLPASPSAGDIVAVADYAGTAGTSNITLNRNGSNFEGGTTNGGIATNRQTATVVYVDATQGWVVVSSNDASFQLPTYISATGGTVTTSGNFKIHTFTGPGTFCVSSVGNPLGSTTVDYLVVAGGGGGGAGSSGSIYAGGGGGAGGYRESSGAASGCYTASPLGCGVSALPVTAQGYPITVGGGGTGACATNPGSPTTKRGTDGANSVFSTITSTGGGVGGTRYTGGSSPSISIHKGYPGGSGGGSTEGVGGALGGSGNTPPVSPAQGKDGGASASSDGGTLTNTGGGGGATQVGPQSPGINGGDPGGAGGAGATSSINTSPTTRAGGGGSGGTEPNGSGGAGGSGGGGAGGTNAGGAGVPGTAGTANTGGGGGGSSGRSGSNSGGCGGNGGSGVVIIRYRFQ